MTLDYYQTFLNNSLEEVKLLEEMLKKMTHLFKDVLEFFVLDPKKNSSDTFFGNLHLFLQEFEVICLKASFSSSITVFFIPGEPVKLIPGNL